MEYLVKLDEEDLRVIAAALNDVAYRFAAPVMEKLKKQTAPTEPPTTGEPTPR